MSEEQNTGQFSKVIVTTVGKEMIAKSQNGQTLTFTRVALGDGLIANEDDPINFIKIKNERLSAPIAKYTDRGNGQFELQFRVSNKEVETGFWHREIGVMAKIDEGPEQLYAYTTAGNKASFLYDKTTPIEERIVNIAFVIGNAQNVQVIVNSSIIYVTLEDMEEAFDTHNNDINAHSNLIKNIFDIENATEDDIKKKIEENAQKVCLPLSGGTMEGLVSLFTGSTVPTPAEQDNSKKISNTEWVQEYVTSVLEKIDAENVGDIVYRPFLKKGYVKLNGATVSRNDYPRLVQYAITNSLFITDNSASPWLFGNGDGETTFVLPDYRNVFIEGGDTPNKKEAGLPNITGNVGDFYINGNTCNGCFSLSTTSQFRVRNTDGDYKTFRGAELDASLSNAIYGNAETVQPPTIVLIPQIKY